MTQWLGPRNAVAYAWFQSRGGVLMHTVITLIAVMGAGMFMGLTAYNGGSIVYTAWAVGMLVVLSGLGVLVGGIGVTGAIRADAGGIHDSLRLMRASPGAVIMGYIFGASSQALCVIVPCLLLGMTASLLGDIGVLRWLWGAMLLLSTVMLGLVASALLGMLVRQASVLVVVIVVLTPMTLGLLSIVPGMALLAGPAAGAGVLDVRQAEIRPGLVLSIVTQFLLATVLFRAAARKFRTPHAMAFDVDLGLALLAIWVIANLLGMVAWDIVQPGWQAASRQIELYHIAGAVVPAIPVALIAWLAAGRRRGQAIAAARALGVASKDRIGNGSLGMVVVSASALILLPFAGAWVRPAALAPEFLWRAAAMGVSVMLFGAAVVTCSVLGHGRYGGAGKWIAGGGAVALAVLPLIVDIALLAIEQPQVVTRVFGPVGFVSPFGQAVELFKEDAIDWGMVLAGLMMQAMLLAGLVILTAAAVRRPPVPPPLPPVPTLEPPANGA